MPPSAEEALVGRDGTLPGLGLVLDPKRLLERLRSLLPEAGLLSARATYLRYKPNTSCLVAYRITGADGERDVHATARPVGAADKLEKSRRRASRPTHARRLFLLEDSTVAISVFPEDAALPALVRLATPERRRGLVRGLVGRHAGPGKLETLRYKPERRWVGRLTTRRGDTFALKAYGSPGFGAALRGTLAFQDLLPRRMPRLVGASPEHRVVALEWIAGQPLVEALLAGQAGPAEVIATGAALADLHRQPVPTLPTRTHLARAEHVLRLAAALAFVQPAVADAARALADELASRLALAPNSVVPTHGDFHAGQVLLADGGAVLIDFDEAAMAYPGADCASFCAHLQRDEIAGRLSPGRAAQLGDALLEGYAGGGSRPRDADLELQTAAALFELAPQFFRDRDPAWPERTEAVLERVKALLQGPTTSRRPSSAVMRIEDCPGARHDVGLPYVAAALQPAISQAHFRRLPDVQARVRDPIVTSIRVVRHKRGRRCLIEYGLRPSSGPAEETRVLGKLRARGADLVTCNLTRALGQSGFGPDSVHGISVPEALGAVPELGLWLQAWVAGVPAIAVLRSPNGPALAARLAEALHRLNRAAIVPPRTHTIGHELDILGDRLERLARERPRWVDRLQRLHAACERVAASLRERPTAVIHRDFYPDQVIVQGDRLHLVDLDPCSLGDPALDVGNFVGHLVELALRDHGDPAALDEPAEVLVDRFAAEAAPGTSAAAGLYATLTLTRHIWLSTRFPERQATTARLLDLCEQRLDLGAIRAMGTATHECTS